MKVYDDITILYQVKDTLTNDTVAYFTSKYYAEKYCNIESKNKKYKPVEIFHDGIDIFEINEE